MINYKQIKNKIINILLKARL